MEHSVIVTNGENVYSIQRKSKKSYIIAGSVKMPDGKLLVNELALVEGKTLTEVKQIIKNNKIGDYSILEQ